MILRCPGALSPIQHRSPISKVMLQMKHRRARGRIAVITGAMAGAGFEPATQGLCDIERDV